MVSSSSTTSSNTRRRAGQKNLLKRSQSKMIQRQQEKDHHELPAHITVQRLNARGAFYIEKGEYTKAIDLLVQALKLWETVEEQGQQGQHESNDNDLDDIDDCIMQSSSSRTNSLSSTRNSSSSSSSSSIPPPPPPPSTATSSPPPPFYARRRSSTTAPTQKSRRTMAKQPSLHDLLPKETSNNESESDRRFIYQRPILTTPQFWRADYTPNNTLSLILILNLAMAHHLSGLSSDQQQGGNKVPVICRKRLQKALQLYELAHQLQIDEGLCSPIATMIIANNVGEIHLSVDNKTKHEMCLRHLLSTMMYMIDNLHQGSTTTTDDSTTQITTFNNTPEWDGFLKNVTSTLILQQNCAGAA